MVAYRVIFDEAARGYREWWFPVALLLAAAWLIFLRALLRRLNSPSSPAAKLLPRWTTPFALLIGLGGSLLTFTMTYRPHARLRDALRTDDYRSVEGKVSWVQPGDPGGFGVVTSEGATREYHYASHQWTPGYRDVSPEFRVGQLVRVADVDGHVARLEVATR